MQRWRLPSQPQREQHASGGRAHLSRALSPEPGNARTVMNSLSGVRLLYIRIVILTPSAAVAPGV